ncbi:MAG TPA: hypothetical protein VIP70_05290 [Nitrososphaeraceae archaeon]
MSELYRELVLNAERINEPYRESVKITEIIGKDWLNKYYSFWNKKLLSSAKEEQEEYSEKTTTTKEENVHFSNEEQKRLKDMFRESLTFD